MIVFVKPRDGQVVRAPGGQPIPPEGMHLELDLYVRRRLRDGDLVEVKEQDEPADPPSGDGAAAISTGKKARS